MKMRALALALLLTSASALPATAQVPLNPRALGMAGASDAVARGQESIFLNPALLGLGSTPYWSVAIPQIAVGATLLGPAFGDVREMIRFRNVSPERQDEILARIPGSGTAASYDMRLPLISVQSGHLGVGLSYGSIGEHSFSRDLVELLFRGYEEGRTDYSAGDTRGRRATFWDVAIAYGRSVGPVSIGLTGHYIHGGSIVHSRLLEPRIDLDAQDIEVEYRTVLARGGQGFGADVGLAYAPSEALTFSASVTNFVSSMRWNDDLRMRHLLLDRDALEHQRGSDMLTAYETSEVDLDPEGAPLAAYLIADGLFDSAHFPAVLRLAAGWTGASGTDVGVSYRTEVTDGRLGDVWERSAAIGVQQRLWKSELRAGLATDLDGRSMLSGGLGLGALQLGLARLNDDDADGFSRSGWIASFGLSVRTTGTISSTNQ